MIEEIHVPELSVAENVRLTQIAVDLARHALIIQLLRDERDRIVDCIRLSRALDQRVERVERVRNDPTKAQAVDA